MKCAEPDCRRDAKWEIQKEGLNYCSGFCAQYDSSRRSKRTKSESMASYGTVAHTAPSPVSSSEEKQTANVSEETKIKSETEKENCTMQTSSAIESPNENHTTEEWNETPNNLSLMKTSDVPENHLPVKYFEPQISSKVVMSQSMNMINESVEQLNSIRKDLHEEYKRKRTLDGPGLDRIRTVCEVNKSIVSMMRLGIELVKEKKNAT